MPLCGGHVSLGQELRDECGLEPCPALVERRDRVVELFVVAAAPAVQAPSHVPDAQSVGGQRIVCVDNAGLVEVVRQHDPAGLRTGEADDLAVVAAVLVARPFEDRPIGIGDRLLKQLEEICLLDIQLPRLDALGLDCRHPMAFRNFGIGLDEKCRHDLVSLLPLDVAVRGIEHSQPERNIGQQVVGPVCAALLVQVTQECRTSLTVPGDLEFLLPFENRIVGLRPVQFDRQRWQRTETRPRLAARRHADVERDPAAVFFAVMEPAVDDRIVLRAAEERPDRHFEHEIERFAGGA